MDVTDSLRVIRRAIIDPNRYQPGEWLTSSAACSWLGISRTTLFRWVQRGLLERDAARQRGRGQYSVASIRALMHWDAAA